MFHFGHAKALEQAKKAFPNAYLIVGVCSDAVTHRYKGKTVMTEDERYESVRHCKWVDEVLKDAPWVINGEFLEKHNIDFVAHDDLPYADNSGQADDVYGPVKALGKFRATQRTDGVSTSDLILRILKDYNEYVLRNLSRGYSRKDLGVSLFKEQRIRASHGIKKLSQQIKEQRLRVADRITKRIGIKPGSAGAGTRQAAAAAAAADAQDGSSSGEGGSGSREYADNVKRGDLLAELIRRNGEELATSVEGVVERIMHGEYGKEVGNAAEQLTLHMDRFVSGCFRGFEDSYNRLEKAIRGSMDWRNRVGASGGAGASIRQRRRRTTLQLMAPHSSSSSSEDDEEEGSGDEEAGEEVVGRRRRQQRQQPEQQVAVA
ncbi:hypothetical protein COO60DRAFT_703437 [Scenedesmus sp. NREL 46B-D3]|nr:hypothetical protein COO60DRAFT_703437 [Scenedesmus sp. NREL 46B-D3]